MGTFKTNKAVWQEYKYIKIPDRRLLSGLLYINVVNHEANDSRDDYMQQLYNVHNGAGSGTVSNEHKYADPFIDGSNTFGDFTDRGRSGMLHSFADYDCFVFHVAGGMSLTGGISYPDVDGGHGSSYTGGAELVGGGYAREVSGRFYWEDTNVQLTSQDEGATWYAASDNISNPIGDKCCHFIKSHLVSRINNASGHGLNQGGEEFYKSRPVQRQTYRSLGGGRQGNTADPAEIDNTFVLSDGVYHDEESDGTALNMTSLATVGDGLGGSGETNAEYYGLEEHENSDGETWTTPEDGSPSYYTNDGNTYFSPVDAIKIYGTHRLVFDSHYKVVGGGTKNYIYSEAGQNGAHVQDWWNLVIDIGLRGNSSSGTSTPGAPDASLVRPQININWQPFGETCEFSISDSPHTS